MMRKKTLYILLPFIATITILFVSLRRSSSREKLLEKRIQEISGVYELDTSKTNLGIFKNDISNYDQLKIYFFENGNFKMNISVPFIADTIGTWAVGSGEFESWDYIYYDNMHKPTHLEDGDQFCYNTDEDGKTYIYINSATPSMPFLGKSNVNKVYFRKVN